MALTAAKSIARPVCASRRAPVAAPKPLAVQRRVVVTRIGFLKGTNPAVAGSKRGDYVREDVSDYFEVGGFLASEGNYDRMDAMLAQLEPIDALLLLAASENDTPKVEELLKAGANPKAAGPDGKSASQLAKSKDTLAALQKHQ